MADRRSPTASRRVTPADLRSVTPRPRPDGGTVIAVYGSRPDVGVATVATALALAFRSLGSEDVGLAELDPRRASRSRGQESAATVAVPLIDRIGDTVDRVEVPGLDAALVRRPDGVWTLAMRPKTTPISDAKAVIVTVDAMRAKFPVSVASLGHQLNERALAAFDAADRIVL